MRLAPGFAIQSKMDAMLAANKFQQRTQYQGVAGCKGSGVTMPPQEGCHTRK